MQDSTTHLRDRLAFSLRLVVFVLLASFTVLAQSTNATLNGVVTDPSGAVVPGAELVLTNKATKYESKFTTNERGEYTIRNLTPGTYELKASKSGFQNSVKTGITLGINAIGRVDVVMQVGAQNDTVTIQGDLSLINFENATQQGGLAPETLNNLPLVVGGAPRSSMSLATLMPGVTTGSSGNAFDARINGGLQMGDEAVMDGASMQQGYMNQSGMVSLQGDFQMSPDMVQEVKVITSNYEAQYGSSTSGQLVVVTKGGTSEYHGAAFEYHRNKVLNARQWGVAERPLNIQNNYGANIGGPVKIPWLYNGKGQGSHKTLFYFNWESFRAAGGANVPTISVPSAKARLGDFTDWKDGQGNLIPVYDPTTTRTVNGQLVRDQVACNGVLNLMCRPRYDALVAGNPFFREYMLKFMPAPTKAGELNNWTAPRAVPNTLINGSNVYMTRVDHYYGDKDHVYVSWWRQYAAINIASLLPAAIATESPTTPQNSPIVRANWEHTFSSTLTHHFTAGYLNRNEGYGSLNLAFANQLPKVAGVASQRYLPSFGFGDGFTGMSNSTGFNEQNITTRPTYVFNNLLQWVRGNHTLKFGGEWRNAGGNIRNGGNESGSFNFGREATALPLQNSGHPIASFLFGGVSNANVDFRTVSAWYPRQNAYVVHGGDTWRATSKATINYGLRWDVFTPMREKYNRLSFFDPTGANPLAGGRPGRLAFAGTEYGAASFGSDVPEKTWKKGFAPRLGIAYSLDSKTVVRAGYGVFFAQAFYPGWGGGMSLDGFNLNQSFSTTGQGGVIPAFNIQNGFPQSFTKPPFINAGFRNGQSILYRPVDANRRPYSQQWNLTIERELPFNFFVSAAYVGNKGTRLPSNLQPLNVLDPSNARVRALGPAGLSTEVPATGTVTVGSDTVREPYAGWAAQLKDKGCNPTVAQALMPFPQYCDQLFGLNENVGNSTFHSFQVKAERRFSKGLFALISYTNSKLITDSADSTQRNASQWNGSGGIISPFERRRNRSLAPDDVPQVLSAAVVYNLPFGKNKQFLNSSSVLDKVVGGWQASTIYRASRGTPFFFRSGACNGGAFAQSCFPGIKSGQNPFSQDPNNFNPDKGPLFNLSAFEYDTGRRRANGSVITVFDDSFYAGSGTRVTNFRGPNFKNIDASVIKNTRITERINFQFRAEFFNLGNFHYFVNPGGFNIGGNTAFNTDVSSAEFGKWNGNVSNPRTIQFGARIEF